MNTSLKSQVLKCLLIAALIAVLPLLSNSFRATYLYFLFNLLIIMVGADAGLLSFFSKAADEKKTIPVATSKTSLVTSIANSPENENPDPITDKVVGVLECDQKKSTAVAKCSSEKIAGAVKVHVLKKCPSTPGLFFVGGGPENEDGEELIAEEDDDEDEAGVPSGQELFQKAETFIGNFYMQLKMQREDSWQEIHGLYHKAF